MIWPGSHNLLTPFLEFSPLFDDDNAVDDEADNDDDDDDDDDG